MAYTKLAYHIVYGTKRREKLITPELAPRLYKYTGGIISKLKGIPVEINGMQEHVHILTYIPSTIALSDFLRIVKAIKTVAPSGLLHGFIAWHRTNARCYTLIAPSGLLYGFVAWHRTDARCYTLIAPSGLLHGFIGLHRIDTRCYTL